MEWLGSFFNFHIFCFKYSSKMSTKKRMPPPTAPGIAKKYLLENFAHHGDTSMKNGHILFVYLKNEKSVAKTVIHSKEILPAARIERSDINHLVARSIDFYKRLSREKEITKFRDICDIDFKCGTNHGRVAPVPMVLDLPGAEPLSSVSWFASTLHLQV